MTSPMRPISCDEFAANLGELLDGSPSAALRDRMDAHRLDCADCHSLATDLAAIKTGAARLPELEPSRDLWSGIESRIGAEVVELPVQAIIESPAAYVAPVSPLAAARTGVRAIPWRALAAASVLVAVTAGVTLMIAGRGATTVATTTVTDSGYAAAMAATRNTRLASSQALDETYDREIATLRKLVDDNRAQIDSATLAIVERNLEVIDTAIAESKAALALSPNSAFLLERLTDAYDAKLRTLRAVAASAPRG